MSSHYIIRDDQSPVLLIYEAAAVNERLIFSLLEWNPTVIIDESSLGFIYHNRINIDGIILNQMVKKDVDDLIQYQQPYHCFSPSEIPLGLIYYLKQKNTTAIDLIGKFDTHTLKIAKVLETNFSIQIYSEHTKYIHLKNGCFRKWSSPGRGFFIYPPPAKNKIEVKNLRSKGDGNFKVEKEGIIEIKTSKTVWIGELIA